MAEFRIVEHVHCQTAEEFLDAVSPMGPHFRRFSKVEPWVYRGHSDDNTYRLLPTALRQGAVQGLHRLAKLGYAVPDGKDLNVIQWAAESSVIRDFFLEADASGLELPEDSQVIRHSLSRVVDLWRRYSTALVDNKRPDVLPDLAWPPPELLSLLALAQHYGLPTCLLDWTRSPLTAAYFAVRGAVEAEDGNVSVWSLIATDLFIGHALRASIPRYRLQIITAPRAANPNLHAQDGVFTLFTPDLRDPEKAVDRRPLDELLSEIANPGKSYSPLLFHFTMPCGEAKKALWYLDKLGVNAAKLFPGFKGAADALRERLLQVPAANRPLKSEPPS